ncbi:MAG: UDP-N-acetylglucosamine 1-carboxyvinyltransferase [Myxococcales bacterium]|nr:MAG: UDP-N-acetylglucosamine 1-carboxyvinyltransferase [Myxococcales bacterium]
MDKFIIHGGAALAGTVRVSGSKNAALPILMASILNGSTSVIKNAPDVWDVDTTLRLLRQLGAQAERGEDGAIRIDTEELNHLEAPYDLVKTMRASVLTLGPLLARFNQAKVSLPGGCAIGARPVDQHLKGMSELGAEIVLAHGYIKARAPRRLRGARIVFDTPTVGGTENVLMAAVLARGITVLQNCAREPEVCDLANALNAMGAKISGIGTTDLIIEGVDELKPLDWSIIPDRIEAGTLIAAAAVTGGDVTLEDCRPEMLTAMVKKVSEMGVLIEETPKGVRVRRPGALKANSLTTGPYPGFPTDMQAQLMALMTVAEGQSTATETIFENRFMHVGELQRMGADIRLEGKTAVVRGVPKLQGASVMATDLRASACLVLAGLVAEDSTEISRIYHLDRGYERLEEKLRDLGAAVERIKE